ncbi:MAG: hypothetical protein J7498_10945 [Sphingobium sp.]|nr:hypothetical protein [Sphingobium sp.]
MLIVTAIIAAVSGTPTIDSGVRTIAPVCEQTGARPAAQRDDPALFQGDRDHTLITDVRKLAKEPAADAYSAVLYTEGQCSKPIMVSRSLGMNSKPSAKAR